MPSYLIIIATVVFYKCVFSRATTAVLRTATISNTPRTITLYLLFGQFALRNDKE